MPPVSQRHEHRFFKIPLQKCQKNLNSKDVGSMVNTFPTTECLQLLKCLQKEKKERKMKIQRQISKTRKILNRYILKDY